MIRRLQISPRPLRPFALLLLIFVLGCPPEPTPVDPTNHNQEPIGPGGCTSDNECPGDEICRHGTCIVETPPQSTAEFGLIITPPNSSNVASQRLSLTEYPIDDFQVVVDPTPRQAGEMTIPGGQPAPDGTLIIQSRQDFPLPDTQVLVRNGEFETHVADGDYDLIYVVDDDRWPRLHLPTTNFPPSTTPLTLQIPALSDLRTVNGEVTREILDLLGLLTQPVSGARVYARGRNSDSLSTESITDGNGEFLLRLPPDDDVFDVIVAPTSQAPLIPHASFAQAIDDDTQDLSLSLGELDLSLLSLTVNVAAETVDGQSPEWDRYRVEISRSLDLGLLLLTPPISSGGQISVQLPLGTYDIEIISPLGDPWSSASSQVSLLSNLLSTEIELSRRPHLQGTLVDAHDRPVDDARILVEPSHDARSAPPPIRSDEAGRFDFWIEAGQYFATFRPPASSGLPRSYDYFTLEPGQMEIEFSSQLPATVIATGRLVTTDGTPVADTTLRAFEIIDGNRQIIIGEARSRSDGTFQLLLPAYIVSE